VPLLRQLKVALHYFRLTSRHANLFPILLVVMIKVEFELHSAHQNQSTIVDTMQLPSNMLPAEFRRVIVEAMGLDIQTAQLTYSVTGQVGRPTLRMFNSDPQVESAIKDVTGAMSRARSKQKGLLVKNAVSTTRFHRDIDSPEPNTLD
jgi:hypothetical protein